MQKRVEYTVNIRILSLGLLYAVSSMPVAGAQWTLGGSVNNVFGYDDNIRMQKQPVGSFEYLLTPTLSLARKERAWDVSASANYGVQQYTNIEGSNYNPYSLKAQSEYRSARTRWGITADYADTLSRNNAVQDTGDFITNSSQIKWAISPSFSYQFNHRDSLMIGAGYSQSTYSSSSFNSNEGQTGTVGWQREWSERLSHNIGAFYNHYQFSGFSDSTSDSYGVNATVNYKLSKIWSFQGTVGARLTDVSNNSAALQQSLTNSQQSSGFLANLGLTYNGERLTSSVSFGRSLAPSGLGNINQQTSFSSSVTYNISKRWQTGISGSYQISEAVAQQSQLINNGFNNRNNLTASSNLSWSITSEWVAQLSYRYRQQDSLFLAESNSVMLTLTYNWMGLSLSR